MPKKALTQRQIKEFVKHINELADLAGDDNAVDVANEMLDLFEERALGLPEGCTHRDISENK